MMPMEKAGVWGRGSIWDFSVNGARLPTNGIQGLPLLCWGLTPAWLKSYSSVMYRSWGEARQALDFCGPDRKKDKRLHLGLLPVPFMGDLLNASIYVLMTNPSVTRVDYREYERPAFRRALLANLKQERLDGFLPFPYLDPQFDWHDGFNYWDKWCGLGRTIGELARVRGMSEPEGRAMLCNKLSVIQMVPYHSASGPGRSKWLNAWPSVRLAGEFLRDTVVPRVRSGEAIVLAMRRVKDWDQYLPAGLSDGQGVMRSANSGEARRVSLGPERRWGQAILRQLRGTS